MGAWEVKSTNKNGSGTAREEEAREGKARLVQRSTIIAFPTARVAYRLAYLAAAKSVKGKTGRAKWRKGLPRKYHLYKSSLLSL